jgi:hypothetical protein
LGDELAERFVDADVTAGGTGSGRVEFQRIALESIRDRDVLLNVFGEGVGAIRETLAGNFGLAIGGHNDWIDVVYGLGLIGGALFLWYHVGIVRTALRVGGAHRMVIVMAFAGLGVIELTSGGALGPNFAPTLALFGLVRGQHEFARRRHALPSKRPIAGPETVPLASGGVTGPRQW